MNPVRDLRDDIVGALAPLRPGSWTSGAIGPMNAAMGRALFAGVAIALAGTLAAAQPPAVPIQGPDDPATTVEAATVLGRMLVPLTSEEFEALKEADLGYPQYSLEDAARLLCAAERISARGRPNAPRGRASLGSMIGGFEQRSIARAVYRQTLEFEQTKLAYREGRASLEDLVAAERSRQFALRRANQASREVDEDLVAAALADDEDQFLIASSGSAELDRLLATDTLDAELNFTRWGPMRVQTLDWRLAPAPAQRTLLVKVRLSNEGARQATVPPLTLMALDRGSRLVGAIGKDARPSLVLQPGQSIEVEIGYEEIPIYAHTIIARFGQGPAPDIQSCNHLNEMRSPDGVLAALSPTRLNGATAPQDEASQRVVVELGAARWVEEGGRRALQITGSAVNRAPIALRMPALSVVLLDAAGNAVGGARLPTTRVVIASGEAQDFTVRLDAVDPLPAAGGRDPMSLMQRISLVVG